MRARGSSPSVSRSRCRQARSLVGIGTPLSTSSLRLHRTWITLSWGGFPRPRTDTTPFTTRSVIVGFGGCWVDRPSGRIHTRTISSRTEMAAHPQGGDGYLLSRYQDGRLSAECIGLATCPITPQFSVQSARHAPAHYFSHTTTIKQLGHGVDCTPSCIIHLQLACPSSSKEGGEGRLEPALGVGGCTGGPTRAKKLAESRAPKAVRAKCACRNSDSHGQSGRGVGRGSFCCDYGYWRCWWLGLSLVSQLGQQHHLQVCY